MSDKIFMIFFGGFRARFNNFRIFLLLLSCVLFFSCLDEEGSEIPFTPAQIERLLSNDSTKTWNLVSREVDDAPGVIDGCRLENELVFTNVAGGGANRLLFDDSCDENPVFDGYWQVLNQNNLPVTDTLIYLFNPDTLFQSEDSLAVDHDTVVNIIESITSRFLTISRVDTLNRTSVFVREDYRVAGE